MLRKAFGEFYRPGDADIEMFVREFSSCEDGQILNEISAIFEETGALKCRVFFSEFLSGKIGEKYREIEIPGTKKYKNGFFFHGTGIYTLEEVKKEIKCSLPIMADYLERRMKEQGCRKAVKLRTLLFEPFGEEDTLVLVKVKKEE